MPTTRSSGRGSLPSPTTSRIKRKPVPINAQASRIAKTPSKGKSKVSPALTRHQDEIIVEGQKYVRVDDSGRPVSPFSYDKGPKSKPEPLPKPNEELFKEAQRRLQRHPELGLRLKCVNVRDSKDEPFRTEQRIYYKQRDRLLDRLDPRAAQEFVNMQLDIDLGTYDNWQTWIWFRGSENAELEIAVVEDLLATGSWIDYDEQILYRLSSDPVLDALTRDQQIKLYAWWANKSTTKYEAKDVGFKLLKPRKNADAGIKKRSTTNKALSEAAKSISAASVLTRNAIRSIKETAEQEIRNLADPHEKVNNLRRGGKNLFG